MADTYSLLDLLLELLRDGEEAEQFAEKPDEYLKSKGLEGICAEDVKDAAPLVLDFAPVSFKGSFDRTYDTGFDAGGKGKRDEDDGDKRKHDDDDDEARGKHGGDDDEDDAVKEIKNILNNYSYTSVDDRDTIVDQSVNQQIYNKGLLFQEFDNDSVVASGDGAVAAGENVYGAATGDGAVAAGGDINGDVVTGDGNVTGHGNAFVKGDDNVVGDENEVGNTDVDVEIKDSFQDNSINDSFKKDESINDSFDDNTFTKTDNSINESFDDNTLTKTETDVDVDDVAVAVHDSIAAVVEDNEVAL
jgi:hypothetical protein